MPFFRKSLHVKGKHCYITGGSSGLGRALALELVRRGADVTIVARAQEKLDETRAELSAIAQPGQKIKAISADLTSASASAAALEEASEQGDIEHIYLCAGYSKPQLFVESPVEDLKHQIDGTYFVAAYTAHAATRMMIARKTKGKIVFVSSFLGYVSFVGYGSYSAGKFAIRGLSDSLRSELLLFGISVHLYMPTGILSPGLIEERKTTHRATKKIEEGDEPISPEACVGKLISGIEKGNYQITNDLITDLIRLQSRGSAPSNNIVIDFVYWLIGGVGVPIWRMITDHHVKTFRKSVEEEMESKGFYRT